MLPKQPSDGQDRPAIYSDHASRTPLHKKPTIGELKDLMKPESTCPVMIMPNGTLKKVYTKHKHKYDRASKDSLLPCADGKYCSCGRSKIKPTKIKLEFEIHDDDPRKNEIKEAFGKFLELLRTA